MGESTMAVAFVGLMAVLAGPVFALVFRLPAARATFAKKQAQFAKGQRKRDPLTEAMGPHRSFLRNWLVASLIFAVFGAAAVAGVLALSP